MSITLERLDQEQVSELAVTIRNAGIAGGGGAGFPTYAKWKRVGEVDALLVNHLESEPNYVIDKWLGRTRATELSALFDALLESGLDLVVISAKEADRDEWMNELEMHTGGTVLGPRDLPLEADDVTGVVFAYTDDRYEFGMESILLNVVAGVVIWQDLPMDHGWLVQNTETLCNIHDALIGNRPMTRKYVHVDGEFVDHTFLEVPVGTPARAVLEAAGVDADELPDTTTFADRGPGWCFEIEEDIDEFGVRKRTNCLLVLDERAVAENTLGNGRIDVRDQADWPTAELEREPTQRLRPDAVNVPLIANPALVEIVSPSRPIVEPGDTVSVSEMITVPQGESIGIPEHASITGEVMEVTNTHIRIRRQELGEDRELLVKATDRLYWTWCMECGDYVIPRRDRRRPAGVRLRRLSVGRPYAVAADE